MNRLHCLHAAAALAGVFLATQAVAADSNQQFDLVCKADNQQITGTNTTGGAIKPLDLDDPFYAKSYSVDAGHMTYCLLGECDGKLQDFTAASGDELVIADQSPYEPDADGDVYAVYQAMNPKTNSLRLLITYYDDSATETVGTHTVTSTCTRAPFSNGGL